MLVLKYCKRFVAGADFENLRFFGESSTVTNGESSTATDFETLSFVSIWESFSSTVFDRFKFCFPIWDSIPTKVSSAVYSVLKSLAICLQMHYAVWLIWCKVQVLAIWCRIQDAQDGATSAWPFHEKFSSQTLPWDVLQSIWCRVQRYCLYTCERRWKMSLKLFLERMRMRMSLVMWGRPRDNTLGHIIVVRFAK